MNAAGEDTSSAELLRRVRALELVARRNVASPWLGGYVMTVRGQGMDFREARPYVQGDPERSVDWNMTARMGTPFVRTYHEEREREVGILLDVSASMQGGWQARSKLDVAVEVAATLALSAVEAGDRVSLFTFRDAVVDAIPAAGGRAQLHRVLDLLVRRAVAPAPRTACTDARAAIHALQAVRGRRRVVYLISDFFDADVSDDLRFLGAAHDVTLVDVIDPFELAGPGPLMRLVRPTEGGRGLGVAGRGRWPRTRAEHEGAIDAAARRLSLAALHVDVGGAVGRALARHFAARRAWSR
jgi:uncharacterized protein (DUF58 family)